MLAALLGRRPEALIMVGAPATAAGCADASACAHSGGGDLGSAEHPIDAVAGFDNMRPAAQWHSHFASMGRRRLTFAGGDEPPRDPALDRISSGGDGRRLQPPQRIVVARNAGAGVATAAELAAVRRGVRSNDALAIGVLAGLRQAGRGARRHRRGGPGGSGNRAADQPQVLAPSASTARRSGETAGRLTDPNEGAAASRPRICNC